MQTMLSLLCAAAAFVLILLDALKRIDLLHLIPLTVFVAALCNPVLLCYLWLRRQFPVAAAVSACVLLIYIALRMNFFPIRDGNRVGLRLRIMIAGRKIVCTAIWAVMLQTAFCLIFYPMLLRRGIPAGILVANGVVSLAIIMLLFANGVLRMFFTSRRMSVLCRAAILLTMWIPILNLFPLWWACRLVYEEYDFALYKENIRAIRADSDICRTRYPLVMVHGIFFRDLKYFNYWGRIPRELTRYGAAVYYGNQQAVGTVVTNAQDIRKKILEIVEETGCEKVNIIAHSKGGLDARYAVSHLGIDSHVASLTTICSPHRGCRFIDSACRMPDRLYRFIAGTVDGVFRRMWREEPDFYTATHQFSTTYSEEFNRTVPDSPNVYYQSYMSKMSSPFSDSLLCVPHCIIRAMNGENDGLVSIQSAKWGEFQGIFETPGRRGISHADMIDLRREDIKGFDVTEAYVGLVSSLKQKGL